MYTNDVYLGIVGIAFFVLVLNHTVSANSLGRFKYITKLLTVEIFKSLLLSQMDFANGLQT